MAKRWRTGGLRWGVLFALLFPLACGADDFDPTARNACQFFVRIPIGAHTAAERQPVYGFAVRGRRDYESVVLDSRMLRSLDALGGGIDAKVPLIGGVAAAAAIVASRKDSSAAQKREEQLQQQARQPAPAPCPNTPPTC